MTPQHFLELASGALGITGALLLAFQSRWAGWAWVLWLMSNGGWIFFGAVHGMWYLAAQHAIFSVTSAIGVYKWLWLPSKPALQARLCDHHFRGTDLKPRDETGMVRWPCSKCGTVFTAPYGLLISEHGSISGPWTEAHPSTPQSPEKP